MHAHTHTYTHRHNILYWGAGVAQWQFSEDAEQELWDVLGSNPALHP